MLSRGALSFETNLFVLNKWFYYALSHCGFNFIVGGACCSVQFHMAWHFRWVQKSHVFRISNARRRPFRRNEMNQNRKYCAVFWVPLRQYSIPSSTISSADAAATLLNCRFISWVTNSKWNSIFVFSVWCVFVYTHTDVTSEEIGEKTKQNAENWLIIECVNFLSHQPLRPSTSRSFHSHILYLSFRFRIDTTPSFANDFGIHKLRHTRTRSTHFAKQPNRPFSLSSSAQIFRFV